MKKLTLKQFIDKYREKLFLALINVWDPKNKNFEGDIILKVVNEFYNQGIEDAQKRNKRKK